MFRSWSLPRTHYTSRQTSVSMTEELLELQDLLLLSSSYSPTLYWKTLMSPVNRTCRDGVAPKSYTLGASG
jgi:hypothetical protein